MRDEYGISKVLVGSAVDDSVYACCTITGCVALTDSSEPWVLKKSLNFLIAKIVGSPSFRYDRFQLLDWPHQILVVLFGFVWNVRVGLFSGEFIYHRAGPPTAGRCWYYLLKPQDTRANERVWLITASDHIGPPNPNPNLNPRSDVAVTGRWVCDDRFYGLVNRSNR